VIDHLIPAREVAERLGLSVDTVRRWSRSGRLPEGFRLSTGVLRWSETELAEWLDRRRESAYDVSHGAGAPYPLQIQRAGEEEAIHAR